MTNLEYLEFLKYLESQRVSEKEIINVWLRIVLSIFSSHCLSNDLGDPKYIFTSSLG